MSLERTLGIIKPDAVARNLVGEILSRVEQAGLKIVGMKMLALDEKKAQGFYDVHRERPFFESLVTYMTSGPVVVFAMEGVGAIKKWRDLMGATDPKKATQGTIRSDFGESIERNATHGSDSPETAQVEVAYFFGKGGLTKPIN